MEDLLPLLLVAAYWAVRALRSRSAKAVKRTPEAAGSTPGGSQAPTPFEQLMKQLELSLQEPRAEGEATDASPDRPPVEPARPVERHAERDSAPRAAPKPPRAVPIGFGDSAVGDFEGFEHEEHGFGAANPYSEETFERRPSFAPRPKRRDADYDPHGLRTRSAASPRRGAVSWSERLHDPAAAREALVLKTIFEGPWRPRTGRP